MDKKMTMKPTKPTKPTARREPMAAPTAQPPKLKGGAKAAGKAASRKAPGGARKRGQ